MAAIPAPPPGDKYLKIDDVCELVGLNKRSIYRNIKRNGFPEPFRVNGRVVRWSERELLTWLAARRVEA